MRKNNDRMFVFSKPYGTLKRGPQVILPKDIGAILGYTAIGKESICVDAGTGSGWLAVALGRVSKQVYSYDIRSDFSKIALKNIETAGLNNVTLKIKDITKKIDERDVDLVTLDMPSAERAVNSAKQALKQEGQIVGYLPHMEQVRKFVAKLERLGFTDIFTIEVIIRDMLVRDNGMRPSTKGIWHTAYLTFATKPKTD